MTMSAEDDETNTRRGDSLRHWCWGVCGRAMWVLGVFGFISLTLMGYAQTLREGAP